MNENQAILVSLLFMSVGEAFISYAIFKIGKDINMLHDILHDILVARSIT